MAKQLSDNQIIRAQFPTGKQKEFFETVRRKLLLNNYDFARLCGVSVRTLTDWKREKFLPPKTVINKLSKLSKIPIPLKTKFLPPFWFIKKAAFLGYEATVKKYGGIPKNEQKRKHAWRKWWEEKGRFNINVIAHPKEVFLPKLSEKLAEFIGIAIGDGGISDYQITITLNKIDDFEYAHFVEKLMTNLFRAPISITERQSVFLLTISRKALVDYCQGLGLRIGNKIKQGVDIPNWVKNNPNYAIACLRGLVDTDGCVFTHRYLVNDRQYAYKKLVFTSYSSSLRMTVFEILRNFNLHPRMTERDVRLDRISDIASYFKLVGTNNSKHLKNYQR